MNFYTNLFLFFAFVLVSASASLNSPSTSITTNFSPLSSHPENKLHKKHTKVNTKDNNNQSISLNKINSIMGGE
jgi:hypothetical protein